LRRRWCYHPPKILSQPIRTPTRCSPPQRVPGTTKFAHMPCLASPSSDRAPSLRPHELHRTLRPLLRLSRRSRLSNRAPRQMCRRTPRRARDRAAK
jgi:hypothetical protein